MQATLRLGRISPLSVLIVTLAMALGVGLGTVIDQQIAGRPTVVSDRVPSVVPSLLPAECRRIGGPAC